MRTRSIFTTVLLAAGFMFANVNAQRGVDNNTKFGSGQDSIDCIRNLSLYRSYMQQNAVKDAIPFWREVFVECPQASKNVYIDGVKITKTLIAQAKDPAMVEKYVDTLALVYDQRIKYFKEEGLVLGRKGVDLYPYSNNNMDRMMLVYNDLKKSVKLLGSKSSAPTVATLMPACVALYKAQKISAEEVVNAYTSSLDVITANPVVEEWEKVKTLVDQLASTSGAFTQEALEQLFQPKFDANPKDVALLQTITSIFKLNSFERSVLYFKALENLHNIEPSAATAAQVGDLANFNKEFEKASEYYKQAISLGGDSKTNAFIYLKLADITFRHLNNHPMARTYAQKSFELDNTTGKALMLIGNIYATTSSCNADDLQKKAVYWIAVDYFIRAKNVDASLTDDANASIAAYSRYFPDKETIFFHGLEEGKSYKIECWINESTIVRVRN